MYCYYEFVIMQYSLNTHIYLVNKICCTIPLIYIQHNILCLDHTVTCSHAGVQVKSCNCRNTAMVVY